MRRKSPTDGATADQAMWRKSAAAAAATDIAAADAIATRPANTQTARPIGARRTWAAAALAFERPGGDGRVGAARRRPAQHAGALEGSAAWAAWWTRWLHRVAAGGRTIVRVGGVHRVAGEQRTDRGPAKENSGANCRIEIEWIGCSRVFGLSTLVTPEGGKEECRGDRFVTTSGASTGRTAVAAPCSPAQQPPRSASDR